MSIIQCKLIISSHEHHLNQIFSGFGELEEKGYLKVKLTKDKNYQIKKNSDPILKVLFNDSTKVVYETHDDMRIFQDHLDWSDYYFKRSYDPDQHIKHEKVFPLGFNYSVLSSSSYSFHRNFYALSAKKGLNQKNLSLLIDSMPLIGRLLKRPQSYHTCAIKNFESLPIITDDPIILFQTRIWPPGSSTDPDIEYINQMRVDCVKYLKNQFSTSFIGGLYPSKYAIEHYPELVITDPRLVRRYNYLKLLKTASICVATAGLWGSNGWKLAEYIAGAKAIVSEKLSYQVPGDFSSGRHYLEYSTAEECMEQVMYLVDDHTLRYKMMLENLAYYQAFLKPGILIWNTINVIQNNG